VSDPVIEIRGLEVFAHHGVHEHERRDGQPFLIDVRMAVAAAAGVSDRLDDAVDYGAVCARVVELARGGPYNLIERLATVIADDLAAGFPVAWVEVTVHKPQAPVPHPFADISVTVRR
jgi:dihydroneopterin aldolase